MTSIRKMKLPKYARGKEYTNRGLEFFNQKKELFKELRKNIKKRKVKLLEIGCGRGILLSQLKKKFPKNLELYGLNLNKHHGIKKRKDFIKNAFEEGIILEKHELPYIHFGNAINMKFKSSSFDIIISQVTFVHIKNKAKTIEEVYRILKPGGIALISLGSYSISREMGHTMPNFYKNLNKKFKEDYNPRFLIRENREFISFSYYLKKLNKGKELKLKRLKFVSKYQWGNAFLLYIRRIDKQKLNLGLKYRKSESEKLTKKYSKLNPVNYGGIDLYDIKNKNKIYNQ